MSSPGEGHNFVSLVDDLNDKDEKLGESESDLDPEVRVSRAENKAKRANDMLTKAAQMGQQLLHQLSEQKLLVETREQECYETQMQLKAKMAMETAMNDEMDHLKDALKRAEAKLEVSQAKEKEFEFTKARLKERCERETQLEERVKSLEVQLSEALETAQNLSVYNDSISGEDANKEDLLKLQAEKVDLLRVNKELEEELFSLKKAEQRLVEKEREANRLRTETERQLEEKECEISSYCRKLEECREEKQELQVELEQVKLFSQAEPGTCKGNSLFSEVEDRRHIVEKQMNVMKSKYDSLKVANEDLSRKLRKTKMHNAALLNMANTCGGRSVDVSQLRHLTDQLSSEQKKNKMLSERLQELEAHVEQKLKKEDFSVSHPGDSYLITMLSDEKSKNRELQCKINVQVRQLVEESDRSMELSKKLYTLEEANTRLKSQNYQLGIKLDEIKEEKFSSEKKTKRKAGRTIFEDIKFREDDKENDEKPKEESTGPAEDEVFLRRDEVDSKKEDVKIKKKKAVSISSYVECEGGTKEEVKEDKVAVASVTEKKPQKKYNEVIDAAAEEEKMKEQCKQQ